MEKNRKYVCPFCKRTYISRKGEYSLYMHMADKHEEELGGLPPEQVYFNYRNHYDLKKGNGLSVISGKPTPFNRTTKRYERFLPEERTAYVQMFRARMRKVYGKESLLQDPEQQKKMLANRSISGIYKWNDGGETTYTGSFEYSFLEFIESLGFTSTAIMGPAPQIFSYTLDGETKFHIPDFYIPSINLLIQIKSSENKHYRLRDIEKEQAIDAAIKADGRFNYLKIYDKQHQYFMSIVEEIVDRLNAGNAKPIYRELQ